MEDSPRKFIKLKDLIGSDFEIHTVNGYKYKAWLPAEGRMATVDTPQEGFSKKWSVHTDKGILDLGSGQMGTLLESILSYNGNANLVGQRFLVKSNGKEGMEVRYYFNPVEKNSPKDEVFDPFEV